MPELLPMLAIAAAVPIAAVIASALFRGWLSRRTPRERGLPRRTTLSVAALLALVATLVVAGSRVIAAEGDMHTYSGTVTDFGETALAGINVSVLCRNCPDGSASDPSANPARPWPAARWGGSGARLLGEATTDASGAWSVTVAEPSWGHLLVVAWDPAGDYAFSRVQAWDWASSSDLIARLADGAQLSGRIRADGALPSTTGFVLTGYSDLLWEGISLVVAADGTYRTPGLPDGQYALSYPADLPRPYVADGSFPLGSISGGMDSTADHDLVKYTSVSGRVTDSAGRALSGIRVVASPVGTSAGSLVASPFGGGEVETAADGTYSIDTVVPGTTFVIEFHSPDGTYASEYYNDESRFWEGDQLEITAGGVSGIDAQLGAGARVSGHVRNAAGEGVEWSWVTLCFQEHHDCRYMNADESGFFEFGGLAPGIYTLRGQGSSRCVVVAEGRHVQADLKPVASQGGFIDVPEDIYYSVPVMTLAEQGVFAGTEWGGGFCPDAPMDRKTMAVWIVRVLDGEDPQRGNQSRFNDVPAWGFHAPFIERMAELEVTGGCGDGSGYCPDRTVTRAQMAAFLSRAYELPGGPDPGFSDVGSNDWHAEYVARLAASGITSGCGDGSGFCPDHDTTRGQMATFLYRAENRAN